MAGDMMKSTALADKVVALVEDGLRGLDRTIITWPAEFRAIIWEAVADTAARRAIAARGEKARW